MNSSIKIAGVQTHLIWENAEANRDHLQNKLQELQENVDVIVLPEMFSTGFSMEPSPLAENMNGPTIQWMKQMSSQFEAAITGSLIIADGGQYYNRMVWVQPSGEVDFYDKRHLFSLAGEDAKYASGKQRKIVSFRGWKIYLNVCYDLRFPIWSRNKDDYDVAIYVANWPKPRVHAWTTLLKARAIENQCFVVGVNRIGQDANSNNYVGQSCIIDMEGFELTTANDNDIIIVAELQKPRLSAFRKKFPFYQDSDDFNIVV